MYIYRNVGLGDPQEFCDTPVEKRDQRCYPLAERWKMFSTQTAKDAQPAGYFLKNAEHQQYIEQFHFLRKQDPSAYRQAQKALAEFDKARWFFPLYKELNIAQTGVHLKLDYQCNIVVSVTKDSFTKLLLDTTIEGIRDEMRDRVVTLILGEAVGKALGLLPLLQGLWTIYSCPKRERLVSNQYHSQRDEADKLKLSFVMDVKANELHKAIPRTSQAEWKAWLVHQYKQFQPKFYTYMRFTEMERSLSPGSLRQRSLSPGSLQPRGHQTISP